MRKEEGESPRARRRTVKGLEAGVGSGWLSAEGGLSPLMFIGGKVGPRISIPLLRSLQEALQNV